MERSLDSILTLVNGNRKISVLHPLAPLTGLEQVAATYCKMMRRNLVTW